MRLFDSRHSKQLGSSLKWFRLVHYRKDRTFASVYRGLNRGVPGTCTASTDLSHNEANMQKLISDEDRVTKRKFHHNPEKGPRALATVDGQGKSGDSLAEAQRERTGKLKPNLTYSLSPFPTLLQLYHTLSHPPAQTPMFRISNPEPTDHRPW